MIGSLQYSDIKPAAYDAVLNPAPAGFIVGTSGTVSIYCNSGIQRIIPAACIAAQTIYPVKFTKMDSASTAANVWFVYD